MIGPEDLDALEDTLELLSDPRALGEIELARDQIHGAKGSSQRNSGPDT